MCRSLKVLCVAADRESLAELKRAAVSADWELGPGATSVKEALAQLASELPHVMVVFGPFEGLVRDAVALRPGLRVVSDRPADGVHAVVSSLARVRDAVRPRPRPAGPVRV